MFGRSCILVKNFYQRTYNSLADVHLFLGISPRIFHHASVVNIWAEIMWEMYDKQPAQNLLFKPNLFWGWSVGKR